MTLPVPYWVYGQVTDYQAEGKASATIRASGASATKYIDTTTDGSGKYQLNIQDYASDGDVVWVKGILEGETQVDSFTLALGDLPKRINLQFTAGTTVEGFTIRHTPGTTFWINKVSGKRVIMG